MLRLAKELIKFGVEVKLNVVFDYYNEKNEGAKNFQATSCTLEYSEFRVMLSNFQ